MCFYIDLLHSIKAPHVKSLDIFHSSVTVFCHVLFHLIVKYE